MAPSEGIGTKAAAAAGILLVGDVHATQADDGALGTADEIPGFPLSHVAGLGLPRREAVGGGLRPPPRQRSNARSADSDLEKPERRPV
ncbi:MAG: hypothetical protein HY721_18075 [Planctomycetes bacterium]|nr:hypothetical protein [Planctomycetota bacterium]